MSNRQVFKREMVAHLWANRSQDSARVSSGNFYFTGPTLYSYGSHFVCGHFLPDAYNKDGAAVVLVNSGSYSMTTNRHMSAMYYALPGYVERVDVPGLNESMARNASRFGCGDVVDALLKKIRETADSAARPRIRHDTRAGLFAQLRDVRADALHLATVDASRRDLSAHGRKRAREQLKALAPDVDAFAKDGTDKDGAAAYAFAMNRAQYVEKMTENMRSARAYIEHAHSREAANEYCGALAAVGESERFAKGAADYATKAGRNLPRAFVRDMRAVSAGKPWRVALESKARAEEIEAARIDYADGEARAREALTECDFYQVSRELCSDFRRAFETLHGEPGDDDRRAFVRELESAFSAWKAKGDAEKAREQLAAARALFDSGRFTAASGAARSARQKMIHANGRAGCAFDHAAIAAADALADAAEARKPEEYAAQLARWRDNVPGALFPSGLSYDRNAGAFLRLSRDGRRVETSQGAEVPTRVCALVWHLIGEQLAAKESRSFAPGSVKLGSFALDSIDACGNVRAGCHFIRFAELADIASRLHFAPHAVATGE